MDDKLFRQKLSEVAEWEIPKISDTGNGLSQSKGGGRPRKNIVELDPEDLDELIEEEPIEPEGPNETVGIRLIKLKPKIECCPDCGQLAEDRVVQTKMCYTNKPHWRTKCTACKMYKNPITNKFDIPANGAQAEFAKITRGTGKYKSKYNPGSDK